MAESLNIHFLLPGYTVVPIGGFRVIFEYADYLARHGHSVSIIFPMHLSSSDLGKSIIDKSKRFIWRMRTRIQNRPLIPWHNFNRAVRLRLVPDLSKNSIPDGDIIVATAWSTADLVAQLPLSKGIKHYIIQHHEVMFGAKEAVNATWLLPMRKVVISKWLEDLGRQLGARDLQHISNGINGDIFRVHIPPAQRSMCIVTLYHTEAFKGVPDALKVLNEYHELFPTIPVIMFGVPKRGPEIPAWITYIQNPTRSALVYEVYNRGTVYLGASLVEGWGLPPAEAMACGCAFVGTDIGGFREFAIHDQTALLSPVGDTAAMLKHLHLLTVDDALRRRIQNCGTEHIKEFTWEKAGSALEKYFLEGHTHARSLQFMDGP